MKKIVFILASVICIVSMTSCGSVSASQYESEVAGYTLKNKKELLEQKILSKKSKTVIATP